LDTGLKDTDAARGLVEASLPALFQSANQSSLKGQRRFLIATRLRLIMLIVAGGSGAAGVGGRWIGFVAAVAFSVALVAEVSILILRPERVWHEGRSAAESAKTLAWRYAVGGEPFSLQQASDREIDQLFLARLREVLRDLRDLDLAAALGGAEQITQPMRELRAKTLEERKGAYKAGRIEDQRVWYAKGSSRDDRLARIWMTSMIAVEMAGVVLGLLRATDILDVDLLGLAATVAIAMAAWMQAKQHQAQARAYFVAAQELAAIHSEMQSETNETSWASFVDQAEEAISREHVLWRASRSS
jgi:hypothetical protein